MVKKGIDVLSEDISKRLGKVALKTASFIKVGMPTKTGRAKNSVVIFKNPDGTYVVGSNVDYMKFIELNTRPHIIEPRNKKALAWPGAANPYKKVKHPGTKGKFIFLKGSVAAEGFLKEEFQK